MFSRPVSRRAVLQASAVSSVASLLPRPLWSTANAAVMEDPHAADLAARALAAARSAQATYADVRLVRWLHTGLIDARWTPNATQSLGEALGAGYQDLAELPNYAVSVRALVRGRWGTAGSPIWSLAEMERLGAAAVRLAAGGGPEGLGDGEVTLDPVPPPAVGTWKMPVGIDPFSISREAMGDYVQAVEDDARRAFAARELSGIGLGLSWNETPGTPPSFTQEDTFFASTDGAATLQTTYVSEESKVVVTARDHQTGREEQTAHVFQSAGRGWDYILDANLPERIAELADAAIQLLRTPVVPIEIGRYDVVFDAPAMAAILNATIAPATELDRARGYLADAQGTSFLNDPRAMIGSYQLGSSLLNISAERSRAGGVQRVAWDGEGVVPDRAMLVTNGILTDYQTTREQAAWLAPVYAAQHRPTRSHGHAALGSIFPTMEGPPDLVLHPGTGSGGFTDLVASTPKGLAVVGLKGVDTDFQGLTAMVFGARVYQIERGKLTSLVANSAFLIRTPEFWKSLVALGNAESTEMLGYWEQKGQPAQRFPRTVWAVPGKIRNVTAVDLSRGTR